MRKMMALAAVAIAALGLGSIGIIAVITMDGAPASTPALPQEARAVAAAEPITPPPVRNIATRPAESRDPISAAPVVAKIEARTASPLIAPPPAPAALALDEQEIQNVAYAHHGRGGGGRR